MISQFGDSAQVLTNQLFENVDWSHVSVPVFYKDCHTFIDIAHISHAVNGYSVKLAYTATGMYPKINRHTPKMCSVILVIFMTLDV